MCLLVFVIDEAKSDDGLVKREKELHLALLGGPELLAKIKGFLHLLHQVAFFVDLPNRDEGLHSAVIALFAQQKVLLLLVGLLRLVRLLVDLGLLDKPHRVVPLRACELGLDLLIQFLLDGIFTGV